MTGIADASGPSELNAHRAEAAAFQLRFFWLHMFQFRTLLLLIWLEFCVKSQGLCNYCVIFPKYLLEHKIVLQVSRIN